jgi:predicted phage terminase large subunit-like protein
MYELLKGDTFRPRAEISIVEVQKYLTEVAAEERRRSLRTFCQRAWTQILPQAVIWGWHMDAICEHLSYLSLSEIRFLMLNVPPRMSKTMIVSVLWPAWHWLHYPGEQFLFASVDEQLSKDSSILSRRLIESTWYQEQWPGEIVLFDDENTVGMYRNRKGGYRMIASLQGRVTGVGGTILGLDDPHDAKKVESDAVRHGALAWHDSAWRSRVNDWNTVRKVYVGQRTHDMDIFGHVLQQEGKRWCVLTLPMEFNPKRRCITYLNDGIGPKTDLPPIFEDPRTEENEVLDPKRMSAATIDQEKAAVPERSWEAQYNQNPQGSGGFILKRQWWRPWIEPEWRPNNGKERPMPRFDEVIQVWDTAFEEDEIEDNDFSARTTWGIFQYTEVTIDPNLGRPVQGATRTCAMLIDALEERMEYPKLRDTAIEGNNQFEPDRILIEKKSSGHSLIQELRKKRLPVRAVKLDGSATGQDGRQGDLVARANSASLMLEKGCIFYPPRPFAYSVIDECAKFPNGDHDDYVSTVVIALMYMRRYHDLELPDDEKDEISPWRWKQRPRKRYA